MTLKINPAFSLQPYLDGVIKEFTALGMEVAVQEKLRTKKSNIDSAFLKPDTSWQGFALKNIIPQES